MKSLEASRADAVAAAGWPRLLAVPGAALAGLLWTGAPDARTAGAAVVAALCFAGVRLRLEAWMAAMPARDLRAAPRPMTQPRTGPVMAVVLPLVLIGVGALWGFASSAGQAVGWSLLGLHLAGAGTRIRGPAHAFWWTGLAGMGTVLLGAAVGADAVLSIHPEAWIAAGWVGMYAAAAAAMEDRNGTDSVIKGAWLPALAAGLGAAAVAVPLAGSPQGPRFLALSAFVIGAALMGGGGFRPTRPPRTGGGLLRWLPASAGESQAWWWSLLLPIEAGVAIASQAAPWNMLAGFVLLAVWPAAYLLARRAARRVDAA